MKLIFLIGIGGFIGSILRYFISLLVQLRFLHLFPFGTLAVNIIGCLFIGILYGVTKNGLNQDWRVFLITGLLGGFSTFSAFSIETVNMFQAGQNLYAILYVLISIIICLAATYVGVLLTGTFGYGN